MFRDLVHRLADPSARWTILRHAALAAGMAAIAGFLVYSRFDVAVGNVPIAVFAAGLYCVAVFFSSALLIGLIPSFAQLVDLMAAARVYLAVAAANLPVFAEVYILSPMLSASLLIVVAVGLGLVTGRLRLGRTERVSRILSMVSRGFAALTRGTARA